MNIGKKIGLIMGVISLLILSLSVLSFFQYRQLISFHQNLHPAKIALNEIEVSLWQTVQAAESYGFTKDHVHKNSFIRFKKSVNENIHKFKSNSIFSDTLGVSLDRFKIHWNKCKGLGELLIQSSELRSEHEISLFKNIDEADDVIDAAIQNEWNAKTNQRLKKEIFVREVEVSIWEMIHAAIQYSTEENQIQRGSQKYFSTLDSAAAEETKASLVKGDFKDLMNRQIQDVEEFWEKYLNTNLNKQEKIAAREFEYFWSQAKISGGKYISQHDDFINTLNELISESEKADVVIKNDLKKQLETYYQREFENAQNKLVLSLIFSLSSLILTVLFGIFLTRDISNPLNLFKKHVKRVGKGNFNIKVNIQRNDELGILAEAFNKMVDTLDDKSKALVERNIEYKEAKKRAEQANKSKSKFLAMMSHEIRTPLNGILGMTDLLMDSYLDKDQKDMAETIKDSGDSLLTVINDILDISKLEADKMDLESIPFRLDKIISSSTKLFSYVSKSKNILMSYEIEETINNNVLGDPVRFRQIINNLISNAIKFTDYGSIKVKARLLDTSDGIQNIRVTIQDTGTGIRSDRLDNIFDPFIQEKESISRKYGGTGLGLSLVKKLVKLMKGKVGVTSELGEGSTFWFDIPFPTYFDDNFKSVDAENKTILLIGANNQLENDLKGLSETHNWNIFTFLTPKKLLSPEFKGFHNFNAPDIIIVENTPPDFLGMEIGKTLQSMDKFQNIPMLFLTSQGFRGDANSAHQIGFHGYLTKPVDPKMLYEAVEQIWKHQHLNLEERPIITKHNLNENKVQYKILVAEDNLINQKVVNRILVKEGHETTIVATGKEAVEALKNNYYDTVLMDMHMPEMDGIEATKNIRKWEEEEHRTPTPIIALTANVMETDKKQCLDAGMNDFITKPIQSEKLRDLLHKQKADGS